MVFLTPLFLLGLLAALIPVAIHLIRREKPPRVMFSTIRFLKKTSKKLVLFQHLQQIALLLLRTAVIVLLVVAFARPLFNQSVARLVDADPQSAVIMIDVSMSMRYGNVFADAIDEALDIVGSMTGGDEVALITFSDRAQLVRELDSDVESIASLIRAMEDPGYGNTRYYPNLRLADQLLEMAQYDNRAVYLISDFQENGMQDADDNWKLAPGVALATIDVGRNETANLVLTDVRSPEQLLEDSAEQQILARVRSTGSVYLDQGEVSLSINGQMVDRVTLNLAERSEAVVTFASVFETEGTYTGEVRVSGDEHSEDNAFYFTVDVLPRIRVLLVNGESSENWFDDEGHWFGLAVGAAETSPFELHRIESSQVSAAALRQSDVTVLLNVGDLNNRQAQAIASYVEQGGSLLIAPGDRVEAERFNRQFAEITPATLLQSATAIDDYLVIADYDRRHPVLRPLVGDWTARFEAHWPLQAKADADVLMQFDNAEPAMVERDHGDGKVMLFASTLDLEWNNLALQGLYLPFVHETLRHLVQTEIRQRAYQVGDNINLDTVGTAASVSATDPAGVALPLIDGAIVSAAQPGFINASIDGNQTRYAVNFLAEESNFARTAPANLYDAVINADTSPIQSREVQTAQMIERLERPQRMWWYILVLVMLLLVAEALIANRTYR